MRHALKTVQPYFDEINAGRKTFEIRKHDRPFEVGDKLILQEWVIDTYTGREIEVKISHIFTNEPKYGLKPGFCILSFVEILPD